jgi:hypothetical protein
MAAQELAPEELYGIAKRIDRELEALPLHTHSAICEMVRCGMQHRQLAMQAAHQQEQKDQQTRQLNLQEQHMKMQQDAQSRAAAAAMVEKPPN